MIMRHERLISTRLSPNLPTSFPQEIFMLQCYFLGQTVDLMPRWLQRFGSYETGRNAGPSWRGRAHDAAFGMRKKSVFVFSFLRVYMQLAW